MLEVRIERVRGVIKGEGGLGARMDGGSHGMGHDGGGKNGRTVG